MPEPIEHLYTIEDINSLPEGQRAELVNGQIYYLATPSTNHQRLSGSLYFRIRQYIQDNKGNCEPFLAPFAVFPFADDKTYLEPDISVICDSVKLQDDGCHGAPDWIIEIVSPTSSRRDLIDKRKIYQTSGVRLYWVILPDSQIVISFDFQERESTSFYSFSDSIPVMIWPGFTITISDILQ